MALLRNKVQTPTTEETTQPENAQPETTEVATTLAAQPPAVQDNAPAMPTIAELENKWDAEEYGSTFPRIVGVNGSLQNADDGTIYGSWIDLNVYSHSDRYMIAPDVKDDDDAKYACRSSYDGKNIPDRDGGPSMTIEEYQESNEDYDEWKTSKYHDIYATAFASEKNSDKAQAAGIVQIQVATMGVKAFTAFKMQTKLAVVRGQIPASHQNCMRIVAVPAKNKAGKDYVQMKFEPIPLDVVVGYTPVKE